MACDRFHGLVAFFVDPHHVRDGLLGGDQAEVRRLHLVEARYLPEEPRRRPRTGADPSGDDRRLGGEVETHSRFLNCGYKT